MRSHRLALTAGLCCVLLLAPAFATSLAATPATGRPAFAAIPNTGQTFPAVYDPVADYEGQRQCDPTPKPGAVRLATLIKQTYGSNQSVGIVRACRIGGTSEHKEGRAVDWMSGWMVCRCRCSTWYTSPKVSNISFQFISRVVTRVSVRW